ncbi:hypothetical protein WN943_023168 [Citrus x changshan-huyou]
MQTTGPKDNSIIIALSISLYKKPSFTRSIKTLISTKRPHPKEYIQYAIIVTVLTTLHAGSALLTFYPNFNLSLLDSNLATTLKKNSDGTVRLTFKPPPSSSSEPPRLSFTYPSMITSVHIEQENLPIQAFNDQGFPIYPAKLHGHFLWDVPASGNCDAGCPCWEDIEEDDDEPRRCKRKSKKIIFPACRYHAAHPEDPLEPDSQATLPIYNEGLAWIRKHEPTLLNCRTQSTHETTPVNSVPKIQSLTPAGHLEEPRSFEAVLNWQTQNTVGQNQALTTLHHKLDNITHKTNQVEKKSGATDIGPRTEPVDTDEENQETGETGESSQSIPPQPKVSKPSNGPWFTFDDIPPTKWRERLQELSAWIDLQMLAPDATTQSALAILHDQFIGEPSATFEAARQELQPEIQHQLTAHKLNIDTLSLGKLFHIALRCLDKLCEQKKFFQELIKDKEPLRSTCKKPYLAIKCKDSKKCDCAPKKKSHFKKSRFPFPSRKRRHFAKDCPVKPHKAIKLIQHLESTTEFSPTTDQVEHLFSEQEEPNDDTIFALPAYSSDSDSFDFEPIYIVQPSSILIHDRTIPIPSVKIQIIPSRYHKPITAIGFLDTGAQRSMLDPAILPTEYWKTQEEHFKAADGKIFTTKLVTKHPIEIQLFPNCVVWIKLIGSSLLLVGFDILHQAKNVQITSSGLRYKSMITNLIPGHYKPISQILP